MRSTVCSTYSVGPDDREDPLVEFVPAEDPLLLRGAAGPALPEVGVGGDAEEAGGLREVLALAAHQHRRGGGLEVCHQVDGAPDDGSKEN